MTPSRPSRSPNRRGQSNVEYMLVIAVLVIAMVSAAYTFIGPFSQGYRAMTQDAGVVLSSGTQNGSGNRR
jgi:uncharacterized protein (UPF0333 family)